MLYRFYFRQRCIKRRCANRNKRVKSPADGSHSIPGISPESVSQLMSSFSNIPDVERNPSSDLSSVTTDTNYSNDLTSESTYSGLYRKSDSSFEINLEHVNSEPNNTSVTVSNEEENTIIDEVISYHENYNNAGELYQPIVVKQISTSNKEVYVDNHGQDVIVEKKWS